jgi:delta(3,5)-delta(2,4)-dienoyl-CoA isomerase
MADGSGTHSYKHFNVTFPQQYVAHVEISRANKLNSFIEA